ncbi:MAG: ABC transporter permease [Gemmataceae bacterium]
MGELAPAPVVPPPSATAAPASAERLPVVCYTPQSPLRQPLVLIRAMVSDLCRARELAWRLFLRDTRALYRQSLLGYFWAVAPPLASMSIWVFLHEQNILQVGDTGMSYPLFVLTGLVLWETFVAALNAPHASVSSAAALLAKINFPREALLLAGLGQVLFNTAIRVAVLAAVFAWYRPELPATAWLAPFGLLALLAFGFALGLLLAPLGMLYHDVGRFVSMGTGVLFFLTPVVYPAPAAWPASLLATANPVSPLC